MVPFMPRLASLLLVLALTIHGLAVLAAPAPKAKTPPAAKANRPLPFLGGWKMHWDGASGDAVFSADGPGARRGGYWCLWAGRQWVGHWRLEGQVLTVTEGLVPDEGGDGIPAMPITWTVTLQTSGRAGATSYEGRTFPFALEPP